MLFYAKLIGLFSFLFRVYMYKLNLEGLRANHVTSLLTRNQPYWNCVRCSLSEDATRPRAIICVVNSSLTVASLFLTVVRTRFWNGPKLENGKYSVENGEEPLQEDVSPRECGCARGRWRERGEMQPRIAVLNAETRFRCLLWRSLVSIYGWLLYSLHSCPNPCVSLECCSWVEVIRELLEELACTFSV